MGLHEDPAAAANVAVFIPVDLADPRQAGRTVRDAVGHFGTLDCAVNAAGLSTRGTMLDTTPELLEQHLSVISSRPSS